MFFFLLGFFFNFACPYISSHETEERRGKGIVVGLGETDFLLVLWNGVVVCVGGWGMSKNALLMTACYWVFHKISTRKGKRYFC